ncbi:DUF397 domain-containing protein [Streptomyces thermolilacinus]|uniref:DUF397 domain-containing protein n=1 Tax=Streptomyces thermolilacinus SPC6 TaxID=1306406 RepID=A0A1D3DV02_9ACTN|nr:DUF397 domain-containing protein [Streptomyces thermolilacinus]OEJ96154.1 hypothetical protein J116_018470 [Streptomyces thermolilacinus SPC6]
MPLPSTGWHKSTCSGDFEDACVEVRARAGGAGVRVRDSKDRTRRPLDLSTAAWQTFLDTTAHEPAPSRRAAPVPACAARAPNRWTTDGRPARVGRYGAGASGPYG